MPELPEVETVVRGVRGRLRGVRLGRCGPLGPMVAEADERRFRDLLPGRTVLGASRRGKWIRIALDGGLSLVVHLGMSGRLLVTDPGDPIAPHTHLRLEASSTRGSPELRLIDPRRFGRLLLLQDADADRLLGDDRLGPEPLSIDADTLAGRIETTRRSIKSALLDQRTIAGIGNIYADEILFDARLHPATEGRLIGRTRCRRLAESIRTVLARAIEAGGTTIRDYHASDGSPGGFQDLLRVYGRAGEGCERCSTPIRRDGTMVAGRSTYWCHRCQRPARRERSGHAKPAARRPAA